jgi:hypothetical protein
MLHVLSIYVVECAVRRCADCAVFGGFLPAAPARVRLQLPEGVGINLLVVRVDTNTNTFAGMTPPVIAHH